PVVGRRSSCQGHPADFLIEVLRGHQAAIIEQIAGARDMVRREDVVFLVRGQDHPGVRQGMLEAVELARDRPVREAVAEQQVPDRGQSRTFHGHPPLAVAWSRTAASWRTAAGVSTWLAGMWTVIEAPAVNRLNLFWFAK